MSISGELYRVSAEILREMLDDPQRVTDELYPGDPDAYEARRAERGLDLDRDWDGLHFLVRALVRRGRLPRIDPVPWHVPAEGTETGAEGHYGPISYRTPEQASEFAGVLSVVTREEFEGAYDPAAMAAEDVYPRTWDRPDEFERLWVRFRELADFYREAAENGEGVLVWLS